MKPKASRAAPVALTAIIALATLGGAVIAIALDARSNDPRWPLFEGGARRLSIGATPAGLTGSDAASCAPCHQAIVDAWRGSLHAAAWTDPVFQASYAREPLSFCRNCHAPLHSGDAPTGVAAHEGISCAVCHVRDGAILGTGKHAAGAPHPVRVEPALGQSSFCAGCHQFGFHARGVETAALQQSTFAEWQARADRGDVATTCQGCHMASVGGADGAIGQADHAFVGVRDVAWLRSALGVAVSAARAGDHLVVSATLRPAAVGHAVPTGDLYRRLVLRAWVDGDAASAHVIEYARAFADLPLPASDHAPRSGTPPGPDTTRVAVADTRVGEDASATRTLDLGLVSGGAPTRVRWTLDYQRMPAAVAHTNGVAAAVNVTRLFEGALAVP